MAFALVVLAGCFGTDTGLVFSHGEHPEQIEDEPRFADCTACHQLAADGGKYLLPSHQGATGCYGPDGGCHDVAVAIEEAQASPSRACLECHTTETGAVQHVPHVYTDVRFAHERHQRTAMGEPIACTRCHELPIDRPAFGEIRKSPLDFPMTMEACMRCHLEQGVRITCETCHVERRKDVPPPSHLGAAWRETHGRAAQRTVANCRFCHEGAGARPTGAARGGGGAALAAGTPFCVDCHLTQRPASHVARWDQTLHGRKAQHDRRRCATCHQAEFCESCHAVAPRSHSFPGFTFPGDGHQRFARANVRGCLACHVFAATCAECHST